MNTSTRPVDFSRADLALELYIVWADRLSRAEAEHRWQHNLSPLDRAEWRRRAGPVYEMYCVQAAAIERLEKERDVLLHTPKPADPSPGDFAWALREELSSLRAEVLEAIEPWVRHASALRGEKGLTISTFRGYRDVPHEDLERIVALKQRLSTPVAEEPNG